MPLHKMTYEEVGDVLFMSERSVRRYVDQYQSTGDVEPRKHRHGPEKMLSEVEMVIVIELLSAKPSIYLDEIQEELYNMTGTYVHNPTTCHQEYIRRGSVVLRIAMCKHSLKSTEVELHNITQ